MQGNSTYFYSKIIMLVLSVLISMILVACTSDATDVPPTVELTAVVEETPAVETPPPPPHEDARIDLNCAINEAEATACVSPLTLTLGDALRIVTRPVSIGLIRYTLFSGAGDLRIEFDPRSSNPATVTDNNTLLDSIEVSAVEGDIAEFVFKAAAEGSVTLTVGASGEISGFSYFDGQWYPLFYWGGASSQPLELNVTAN